MPSTDAVITEKIQRVHRLSGLNGPLTAAQSFGAVASVAAGYDRRARLFMVVSGEDIDVSGRAGSWEFLYLLPNRRARAVFQVRLCDDSDAGAPETNCLVEEITPFPPPGQVIDGLARSGAISAATLEGDWQRELARHAALPLPFRDSPEAVRSLVGHGADFVAGSTRMRLTASVLSSGTAVWRTYCYDQEYQTPFELVREEP